MMQALSTNENPLCMTKDGLGRACGHLATGRCSCGRTVCDKHTVTGHGQDKCVDCDYEVYLGSPGA